MSGDDLTVEEVVAVFNEVNSAGTTLTKSDLALARVCTVWPEARTNLRSFSEEMGKHGFPLDLNFLIRALAATSCGSVLLEGSFFTVNADEFQAAWKKVKTSIEHLVNVLKHDAYIDTLRDLPTPNVLLPIVVYLSGHGGTFTSPVERAKFLRWMFLACVWARYSGSTESTLQKDIALLGKSDPTKHLIEAIKQERGRLRLETSDVMGKGAGTPLNKMTYVVARAADAQDWFSGLTLYKKAVGKSNGLEEHHIFPKAVLYKSGYDSSQDRRIVNEVTNRAFLTKRANGKILASNPETYFPDVQAAHPGALQAQAVPMDRGLWKVESYPEFLKQRSKLLAQAINGFLDGLVPSDEKALGGKRPRHHYAG